MELPRYKYMCSTTAKLENFLLVVCFYLFLIKPLPLKKEKKMERTKAANVPFLEFYWCVIVADFYARFNIITSTNLANRMKQF